MEILIKTTAKQVEMANYILAQAISALKENERKRKDFKVSLKDLESADTFRAKLVTALIGGG